MPRDQHQPCLSNDERRVEAAKLLGRGVLRAVRAHREAAANVASSVAKPGLDASSVLPLTDTPKHQ